MVMPEVDEEMDAIRTIVEEITITITITGTGLGVQGTKMKGMRTMNIHFICM